jgi:hypothetical protein
MAMAGASARSIRVAVCRKCRDSAQAGDYDTWQRIKALLISSADAQPKSK